MTTLARWVAVVLIDGLDLVSHLARAYGEWHDERHWGGTSGAVTTLSDAQCDRLAEMLREGE